MYKLIYPFIALIALIMCFIFLLFLSPFESFIVRENIKQKITYNIRLITLLKNQLNLYSKT